MVEFIAIINLTIAIFESLFNILGFEIIKNLCALITLTIVVVEYFIYKNHRYHLFSSLLLLILSLVLLLNGYNTKTIVIFYIYRQFYMNYRIDFFQFKSSKNFRICYYALLISYYTIIGIFLFNITNYKLNLVYIFSIYLILNFLNQVSTTIQINKEFMSKYSNTHKVIEFLQEMIFPHTFIMISIFYLVIINNMSSIFIELEILTLILITIYFEVKGLTSSIKHGQIRLRDFYKKSVLMLLILFVLYLLFNIDVTLDEFKDIHNFTNSIISSIGVVNIASLFIILQTNFSKYKSSYLIFNILSRPFVLIFTLLPFILIFITTYFIKISLSTVILLPIMLVLTILSTVFTILYLRKSLETTVIICNLLNSVSYRDFDRYKNNIIHQNEHKIDSALIVIKSVIDSNDVVSAYSLFFNLCKWVKENINYINDRSSYYGDKVNNKFNNFFDIIIYSLVDKNNDTLHEYFIDPINRIVLSDITAKNYSDYTIIYNTLSKYIIRILECKNEKIAYKIFRTFLKDCPSIIIDIPNKNKHSFNETLYKFNEIFIDTSTNAINKAVEFSSLYFLKRIHLYDLLFKKLNTIDNYSYWDDKFVDIVAKTRHSISSKNKFLIDNNVSFYSFDDDYEVFIDYFLSIKTRSDKTDLGKYFYDSYIAIVNYSFESKNDYISKTFHFLFQNLRKTNSYKGRKEFLIHIFLISYYIDLYINNNNHDKNYKSYLSGLWNEFMLHSKEFTDKRIKKYYRKTYKKLVLKNPNLLDIKIRPYNFRTVFKLDIFNDYEI